MFSVSPAEILTIAVVALLVFGPRRLPEIARKAGSLLRELRGAADELKAGLEAEYRETLEPLKDVRDAMQEAISSVGEASRPFTPTPKIARDEPEVEQPGGPEPPQTDGDDAGSEGVAGE